MNRELPFDFKYLNFDGDLHIKCFIILNVCRIKLLNL